jgi:hypothetical protein
MLTDSRIAQLLQEAKPTLDAQALLAALRRSAPRHGHRRAARRFVGDRGTSFAIHLRQSAIDAYAFSVILTVSLADNGPELRLRRHNGRGHSHVNKIEGTRLPSTFHVHIATERYQQRGFDIDGFAEATTAFSDLATALDAMLRAANFTPPDQGSLW